LGGLGQNPIKHKRPEVKQSHFLSSLTHPATKDSTRLHWKDTNI